MDSGGPRIQGSPGSLGPVWGINSGWGPAGIDYVADVVQHGVPGFNGIMTIGASFSVNNTVVTWPTLAAAPANRAIAGDFDGSGRVDIALFSSTVWGTIPIAHGTTNGDGTWRYTNTANASAPGWGRVARHLVSGDFNGDTRADIAFVGAAGWNQIPVAFGNANGTFTTANFLRASALTFNDWSLAGGNTQAVAGDFDGDGKDDIALVGGPGWGSIPMAKSLGTGEFTILNEAVTNFPSWAQHTGAKALAGDFNNDTRDDIVLSGPSGWTTVPVAFGTGSGKFDTVTNNGVAFFPGYASSAGAKLVAGDFDGDGRTDLAALGATGKLVVSFAFARGSGTWLPATLPLANFSDFWAQAARFAFGGKLGGDGRTDIVIAGGSGWSTIPGMVMNPAF